MKKVIVNGIFFLDNDGETNFIKNITSTAIRYFEQKYGKDNIVIRDINPKIDFGSKTSDWIQELSKGENKVYDFVVSKKKIIVIYGLMTTRVPYTDYIDIISNLSVIYTVNLSVLKAWMHFIERGKVPLVYPHRDLVKVKAFFKSPIFFFYRDRGIIEQHISDRYTRAIDNLIYLGFVVEKGGENVIYDSERTMLSVIEI